MKLYIELYKHNSLEQVLKLKYLLEEEIGLTCKISSNLDEMILNISDKVSALEIIDIIGDKGALFLDSDFADKMFKSIEKGQNEAIRQIKINDKDDGNEC